MFKKIFIFFSLTLSMFCLGSCNSQSKGDLDEYKNLPQKNNIEYFENFDNMIEKVQSGTHYLYFGKPNCPWCQEYLPYFDEYAKKYNKVIYYYNAEGVKGTYEIVDEDGNISFHVNEEYMKIVNWIYQFDKDLSKKYVNMNFNLKDSKGNYHMSLWLYVPRLFKVVDGKIVDCVGTIEGHEKIKDEEGNVFLPPLNDNQKELLNEKLDNFFLN